MYNSSYNSSISSRSSKQSNQSYVDSAYSDGNYKPMSSPINRPYPIKTNNYKSPSMGYSNHPNSRYGNSRPMTNGSLSSQGSVRSNRSNSNVSQGSHGHSPYGGMAMISPRVSPRLPNISSPINPINQRSMEIKSGTAPPKKIIKAIHSYSSTNPKELNFKEGDFFFVVQEMESFYLVCNPLEKTQGIYILFILNRN